MNWMDIRRKHALPDAGSALPGRDEAMPITDQHAVFGAPLLPPYAAHLEQALFGMGCFWGVERLFWQIPGVVTNGLFANRGADVLLMDHNNQVGTFTRGRELPA